MIVAAAFVIVLAGGLPSTPIAGGAEGRPPADEAEIVLPAPDVRGSMPLERALAARRSVRRFSPAPLTMAQVSQLLWAAQGITGPDERRTAPSAGALYGLEVSVVLPQGIYRYDPGGHRLVRTVPRDVRRGLHDAALSQEPVLEAPAVIVIATVPSVIAAKYGRERAARYALLEAGHAAQNVLLEAVALGLGAVPIGAFRDRGVREVLGLSPGREPVYLIPVGKPSTSARRRRATGETQREARWRRPVSGPDGALAGRCRSTTSTHANDSSGVRIIQGRRRRSRSAMRRSTGPGRSPARPVQYARPRTTSGDVSTRK